MKAIKCDRCGKFYVDTEEGKRIALDTYVDDMMTFGNSESVEWKRKSERIDLCADCHSDLLKFLNGELK